MKSKKALERKALGSFMNQVNKAGRSEKIPLVIIGGPLAQHVYERYLRGELTVKVTQLKKNPF